MPNGGEGARKRFQKQASFHPPKRAVGQAATEGRLAAMRSGGRTTAQGELGALPSGSLGISLSPATMEAEGIQTRGLHGIRWRQKKFEDGPHYSWLRTSHEHSHDNVPSTPSKPTWTPSEPPTPRTCEASVTGNDDVESESAEVVIIGGGPHSLAALAALKEGSKDGPTVCVIDPGSHFMQSWNSRFDALEIKHLRSPAFAHPLAFEPTALVDFAVRKGRTAELIDAPVSGAWVASTDMAQDALLKALPSNALFRDFCASLEARLPHRWLSASATSVDKDASTGRFLVTCRATADQRMRTVAARAVILATGPVSQWNIPAPFEPHLASRLVLHTEELLGEGKGTLREELTRRCPKELGRVLVIGGGISAVQAALAAHRAGHSVVLRSRRPLQTAPFDVGSEWLDMRTAHRVRFEFLCLPMTRRAMAIRNATPGGSVPANYMAEVLRLQAASNTLQMEVDEAIDRSHVSLGSDGGLVVNGQTFTMVILATGVVTAPSCAPLYQSIRQVFNAPTVAEMPRVDSRLRWVPGEDLFVLGANATLELGPGGGNLMGAMRGARIVSNELCSLMGKPERSDHSVSSTSSNQYASLGDRVRFGDGCEAEIDFLAQQLKLTPQAELALRRGRKGAHRAHGKATPYLDGALKGFLKGQKDPIGHLTSRTRWATYW